MQDQNRPCSSKTRDGSLPTPWPLGSLHPPCGPTPLLFEKKMRWQDQIGAMGRPFCFPLPSPLCVIHQRFTIIHLYQKYTRVSRDQSNFTNVVFKRRQQFLCQPCYKRKESRWVVIHAWDGTITRPTSCIIFAQLSSSQCILASCIPSFFFPPNQTTH